MFIIVKLFVLDSESQSTFTSSSAAGTESVYAMKAFSEINKEEIMKEKNAAILEVNMASRNCF